MSSRFQQSSPITRPGFYESLVYRVLRNRAVEPLILTDHRGDQHTIGDGQVNKNTPELQITDPAFYRHVVLYGETGFGEAYVEGWITSPDIGAVLQWFVAHSGRSNGRSALARHALVNVLGIVNRIQHFFRSNTVQKARDNISYHYDLSNDLYKLMLDPTMAYSCGIYKKTGDTLETAQQNKYEAIGRKLCLKPGMTILEIGSGWGGLSVYLARKYKVKITTITISDQQFIYVQELIRKEKLTDLIEVQFIDYRKVVGKYDRVVSVEMAEALGFNYLDSYFGKISEVLKPEGIAVLQVINFPENRFRDFLKNTDFIQKHIFPGSALLSTFEIMKSLHRTGSLNVYDIESLGESYVRTLSDWRRNFNKNIKKVRSLGFDDKFIRKWNYYLIYCETGFATRYINDLQLVLSRPQNPGLRDLNH